MAISASRVELDIRARMEGFKDQARAVKEGYHNRVAEIRADVLTSDLAKDQLLDALRAETTAKMADVRAAQDRYIEGKRIEAETALAGIQPSDAQSVMLRRDAAERARKIETEADALTVLADAKRQADDSLADAVGHRARHAGWVAATEAYIAARPEAADAAGALAYVEGLPTDHAHNLSNSITFSSPF